MTETEKQPTTETPQSSFVAVDSQGISKPKRLRESRRRGIYILPSLFTTGSLFFGFFAVIQTTQEQFDIAAIAIVIATVLDGLDGRIARLTNTTSHFGKEYDSLSDVICFGCAPGLLAYMWALDEFGNFGILCAFLFASATALRLARFNTTPSSFLKYFQGLPCPMAAGFLVTWVWVSLTASAPQIASLNAITLVGVVVLALLMVSNVPYLTFKNVDIKGRVPFIAIILIVLAIAVVSVDPPKVLFLIFLSYVASGPIIWLNPKVRRKARTRPATESPEQ